MSGERLLLDSLKQGFYIQNLHHMGAVCKELAQDRADPVPFFVLRQIFLDIAREWEGRPVLVEDAKELESKIVKPLEELVQAIASGSTSDEVARLLRIAVSTYLSSIP